MKLARIKKIHANWHFTTELGDEYDVYEVGKANVSEIIENEPHNGLQKWNYLVHLDNGTTFRLFNVSHVEYFKAN